LYYRDQSAESLVSLCKTAEELQPTKIVELGTLSGLSLRAWTTAACQAEIIAIDLSFAALRESESIIPLNLSKVRLIETDILKVDFPTLWSSSDRVLLFIDAHDLENVPIMEYVLNTALPALPQGSLVMVDDLWHSSGTLDSESAKEYFRSVVINEIDPLLLFEGHFAPYWKGGSFFGFREVVPLLSWANSLAVELSFQPNVKSVKFLWPAASTSKNIGCIKHHPLDFLMEILPANSVEPIRAAASEARRLYGEHQFEQAATLLSEAFKQNSGQSGWCFAIALCAIRANAPQLAVQALKMEETLPKPHPRARELLERVKEKMLRA
jgi:predicted O-methyltransferase YrrM